MSYVEIFITRFSHYMFFIIHLFQTYIHLTPHPPDIFVILLTDANCIYQWLFRVKTMPGIFNKMKGLLPGGNQPNKAASSWHPKFYLDSPDGSISMEKWVDRVIKELNKNGRLASNKAWGIHLVFDNFPPEHLEYYQALQQRIAQWIKIEEDRPTITVRVRGSARQDAKPFFAYLGGTGPLSDAATMLTVREAYNKKQGLNAANESMSVDLLSCPPPREKAGASHYFIYLRRITKFLRRTGVNMCFLSNTAHLNILTTKGLLYIARPTALVKLSGNTINNMVKRIVNAVQDTYKKNDNILILGTQDAQNGHLYDSYFKDRQMKSYYPGDGSKLQRLINAIKAGDLNKPFENKGIAGYEFIKLILESSTEGTTHILLSCTELPLCFHSTLPKSLRKFHGISNPNATYRDLFKKLYLQQPENKRLPNNKIPVIVDSEEKIAEFSIGIQLANEQVYDEKHPDSAPPRHAILDQEEETTDLNTAEHALVCSPKRSDQSQNFLPNNNTYTQVPNQNFLPSHHTPACSVPDTIYNEGDLEHIDAYRDLILYAPDYHAIQIDVNQHTQAQKIKQEMAIAGIKSAIALGVAQPIQLSGHDCVMVRAAAIYCRNHGYGFYVTGDIKKQIPPGLHNGAAHPQRHNLPDAETIQNNINTVLGKKGPHNGPVRAQQHGPHS